MTENNDGDCNGKSLARTRAECMGRFGRLEVRVSAQKEMTDKEICSLRDLVTVRLDAMDTGVKLAAENLGERLAHLNNVQRVLKEQADMMVTRNEWSAEHRRLVDDIKVLNVFRAEMDGKASTKYLMLSTGIALFGVLCSFMAIMLHFVER
jgi:hypothetical protein